MFCPSCGAPHRGARFCGKCGGQLPPPPQAPPPQLRMGGQPGPNGMPQPVRLMPTQAIQLPGALNRCYLGLSWQSFPGRRELDLDASAALFSRGQCVDIVSFAQLRDKLTGPQPPFSTVHTGDVLMGGGGGANLKSSPSPTRDLERIYFDLYNLPPQVDCVCLLVNCFSEGANFAELQRATCRIVNADSEQVCLSDMHAVALENTFTPCETISRPIP